MGDQGVGGLEQFQEQAAVVWIVAEAVIDQGQVLTDQADGGGAHAADVAPVGEDDEQFQQGAWRFGEDPVVNRLDGVRIDLESLVDALALGPGGCERLLQELQDDVVDLPQGKHPAVVLVHEALNARPGGGVGVAELLGEGALVLELQPVVLAFGDQMQAVAHPPQVALAIGQPAPLLAGEDAEAFQLSGIRRAVLALANPKHGLQIAQAAGRVLDVGFKVGLHVLEALMTPLLLRALGSEVAVGRPGARVVHKGVELVDQPPQRRAIRVGEQAPLE